MKAILTWTFAISTLYCPAQSAPPSGAKSADAILIDSQVNRLVSDLNTHQFSNMNSYATEDFEWVNIVGMWWKGRANVIKAHEITFDRFFKGVPFTRTSSSMRFLSADVAVVHLNCHVGSLYPPDGVNRGNNATPETDDLLILVYVKQASKWLLSVAQNTVVDPKAAKGNPIPEN